MSHELTRGFVGKFRWAWRGVPPGHTRKKVAEPADD